MAFEVFLSFLGLILFFFVVFLTSFDVCIGFRCDFRGHRVGKM